MIEASARASAAPLALVAVALALYGPALDAPWVWDDGLAIVQNPNLRALWPLSTALGSPSFAPVTGRPTASLSLALNYALSGLTPAGFRAGNLLIHVLAALALFGVVRRTLLLPRQRERFGAAARALGAATALLWLVHPLVTECVAYITQRTESLMALFALATLYASARGAEPGASPRWSAAAVAFCALGMGSKEVMVVAPLLVLAHDAVYAAGSPGAALRARPRLYAGLAATWVLLAIAMATGPDYAATKMGFEVGIGPIDYALSQAPVLLHYFRLALWPQPLALDYGDWIPAELATALPAAVLVLALVALAGALLWRAPRVGFPLAALFVVLAPSSSFVPVGGEIAAERRMYLPLAGFCALAVCGAQVALARAPRALRVAAFAVPALALALASRARLAEYRDPIALWESAVEATPQNPRPHLILGNQLERAGRRSEALASYERALALDPGYVLARVNYGGLLRFVGRVEEATAALEGVLAEQPRIQFAHHNLGLARLDAGEPSRAIAEFRAELEVQPTFVPAMLELTWILAAGPDPALRDPVEAARLARRARELSGDRDAAVLDALAAAQAAGGSFDAAIATAERAAALAEPARRARIAARIERYRRGEPFVGRP
jgi:tetratricopeptide (TPR) repeat protein